VRDDRERLSDMVRAIDQVVGKTGFDRSAFESNEMLQVWVMHHLQIIGEAARCLSQEFRLRYPDKVWAKAAGMRHILVHHYFEIETEQVWKVVQDDLPRLREIVTQILNNP